MAAIVIILGGVLGFGNALAGLWFGLSPVQALALWLTSGLVIVATTALLACLPRRSRTPRRA